MSKKLVVLIVFYLTILSGCAMISKEVLFSEQSGDIALDKIKISEVYPFANCELVELTPFQVPIGTITDTDSMVSAYYRLPKNKKSQINRLVESNVEGNVMHSAVSYKCSD